MTLVQIIPILAYLSVMALVLLITFTDLAKSRGFWVFWAVYGVAYLVFTLFAIAEDGPLMFYINHSQNWVGNQVWIDLVFAILIGWLLVLPEARARGMNTTFWMVFIIVTATIGFAFMVARLLYLRGRDGAVPTQTQTS